MSEYKEPMELDEAYKLADAVYAAGYKDRHNERDYDPRKCPEWQAVVDPLIQEATPEAPASEQRAIRAGTFAHLEQLSQASTRPYEPIYQVWQITGNGGWLDTDKDHYDSTLENIRRITYIPAATTASASEPINTDGMSDGEIYADVSRRALASPRNAEPASTAPAKPAYTRTDAMLAFSAMCDTSLITRPAAEAMRDTLCTAVEQPAPETHPKAGASDA